MCVPGKSWPGGSERACRWDHCNAAMDPVHAATCRSATAWQACAEHAERAAVHGDKRRASVPTFERSPSKGRTLRPGRMFGCHSDSNSQLTKLRYPAFAASMISTAPSAPVPLRPSTQYSFSARRTSSRPHHVQSFSSSRDPVSSRATSRRLRTTTGWPRWSTQAFRPAYGRSVQSGVGGGGMLPCNPRFRRAASASRSLLWAASMSKRLRWMSVYSASGSFGMARAWDGDGVRVWSCSFRHPGEPRLAVLHGCMAGQG